MVADKSTCPAEKKVAISKYLTRVEEVRGLLLLIFALSIFNLLTRGLEEFSILFYIAFFPFVIFEMMLADMGFWFAFLIAGAVSLPLFFCFYFWKKHHVFLIIGCALFVLDALFFLLMLVLAFSNNTASIFSFFSMQTISIVIALVFFARGMYALAKLKANSPEDVRAVKEEVQRKRISQMDTESMRAAIRKFDEGRGILVSTPKAILEVSISQGRWAIMTVQEEAFYFYVLGQSTSWFLRTTESRVITQQTEISYEDIARIKRTLVLKNLKLFHKNGEARPAHILITRSPSTRQSRKENLIAFREETKRLKEKYDWK